MTLQCSTAVTDICLPNMSLRACGACDPIWNSIRTEALAESRSEPALGPWLESSVLQHRTLEQSLGYVLDEKLYSGESSTMQRELADAIQADPAIRTAIMADLHAIRSQDPATADYLTPFLLFKGFLALEAHRIAHWLWNDSRNLLARHIQSRVSEVFAVDIHPAARIGQGVFIDHATGVVIGETARIGNGATLLHGVTLGGNGKESGDRHPKIGDGVLIGAGAQILGNVEIGDNAKIGAGSTVVTNTSRNTTVVGVAAREVQRKRAATTPLPVLSASQFSSS